MAFFGYRALRDVAEAVFIRNAVIRRRWRGALPLPPGRLLYFSTTSRNLRWFLESGEHTARAIKDSLASIGRPLESFRRVLDFGCGCGRVLRQWVDVKGPQFLGSDYNPLSVAWVAENLPHATVRMNALRPPLQFDGASVDFVYAISVFTHWPAEMQQPWLNELHRVLEPGGVLLLTLDGDNYSRLRGSEKVAFDKGELVVNDGGYAGTNLCAAYHPAAWVREHFADGTRFRELSHIPGGGLGANQDLWLLERVD